MANVEEWPSRTSPTPSGTAGLTSEMNGAQALVGTLLDSGVEVCFANPGTSEMQFVAALDSFSQMRGVLCLFEGVATGAADGYGRMAGRPAATLLHLGPGLANGIANLHNARRAGTPVLNIVGDHASDHKPLDSLLESDIDAVAGSVSSWLHRSASPGDVGHDAAAAIAAALGPSPASWPPGSTEPPLDRHRTGTSGSVATLIVPADVSWSPGGEAVSPVAVTPARQITAEVVEAVAARLRSPEPCVLLLDGAALTEEGLRAADRIRAATGAQLFSRAWPTRQRRGAGTPVVEPLAYRGEQVAQQLGGARHLILAGARTPVASFAYPGRSGDLTPAGLQVHVLAPESSFDVLDALSRLADEVALGVEPVLGKFAPPLMPLGPLSRQNWTSVIGALLPPEAIVVDESITAGMESLHSDTATAAPHDLLGLTGLAIGQGLPVALGAAIACPQRPVICLQADGSAMYTLSALWTQARERVNVTTVLLNNKSYAILRAELARVGAAGSSAAQQLIDLDRPELDFVALATGMGVPATRATTAEQLAEQFAAALREPGPHLIEAVLG